MMSEKEVKRWGKKVAYIFMVTLLVLAVCFASYLCLLTLADLDAMRQTPETKTLMILHTWEEGGQYYFADELGCVYLIGCGNNKGEIRYDDMPKTRFDRLEEGHRYNVEYVLIVYLTTQKNVRMSLGEKEI